MGVEGGHQLAVDHDQAPADARAPCWSAAFDLGQHADAVAGEVGRLAPPAVTHSTISMRSQRGQCLAITTGAPLPTALWLSQKTASHMGGIVARSSAACSCQR